MKTAKELYPEEAAQEEKGEYFYGPDSYQPILNEFGHIVLQVDEDNYSGDSWVLYDTPDGKIGYLEFGWGSCSGCDALQGSNSMAEVQQLMDELYVSIKWFDNKASALAFFKTHDWVGDYSWAEKEQQDFVEKAIKWLSEEEAV